MTISTDVLRKLYIEITSHCNLDCLMCARKTWVDEANGHMPLATFERLMQQVEQLPQPPIIHLGGYGEPMAHPDFLEIIRRAKATGAKVEMTTNATLLTAETANALIDLDLNRLMVSMEGVTPESYDDVRVNGNFNKVLNNLRYLRRLKLRRNGRHSNPQVGIAFVAMKRNIADLPRLPWLATYIGAWEIQVSNVVPHTPEMEDQILYRDSLKACAYRASRWVADMSLPKLDLDAPVLDSLGGVFNSTTSLSLLGTSLSSRNDYCRFAQEGYSVVRWDGVVSPCLPLLHSHPMYLLGRRKDVTHLGLGNIGEEPLGQIWESPEYTEFRDKLRRFPFSPCTTCGGCERFPANQEDCSMNEFPACGGCLWAQGFIQCP